MPKQYEFKLVSVLSRDTVIFGRYHWLSYYLIIIEMLRLNKIV